MSKTAYLGVISVVSMCMLYGAAHSSYSLDRGALEKELMQKERKLARFERKLERQNQTAREYRRNIVAYEQTEAEKIALKQENENLKIQMAELKIEKEELNESLAEAESNTTPSKIKTPSIKVHYFRSDKDYYGWGVHAVGNAVKTRTSWGDPIDFRYINEFGAYAKVKLHKDHKKYPLQFLVHSGPSLDCDPDPKTSYTKSEKKMLTVDASKHKEVWLVSGIAKVFTNKIEAIAAVDSLKVAAR